MVQFDRRLASGMGCKNTWLAGDAVHMTSPVGVQSMNAGLIDAHELCWRLAEVLSGDRDAEVLQTYPKERLGELERLIRPDAGSVPGGAPEWVVRRWSDIVSSIPATGDQLSVLAAQLKR
jgi:2-polyprenyl-6-methoxyphenol hydroxylase-like FAD-dependent oxidoreductase